MLNGVEVAVDQDVEDGVDDAHRALRHQVSVGVKTVANLLDLWEVIAVDADDAVLEHPHQDPRDNQAAVGVMVWPMVAA